MDMRRRFECSKKLRLSSKMAVGDSFLGAMISLALGIWLGLQYQAWCSSSLVDLKTNQTSDCQTDMWVGGVYCLFVYNMEYENRKYQKPGKYTGIIHTMNSGIQVIGNGEWNNGGGGSSRGGKREINTEEVGTRNKWHQTWLMKTARIILFYIYPKL